ncbi:hypothetical protein EYC98_09445 [Halieaceae bacterium IMCC14734]|uniref:Uncharacterized protein n=1 Tax=Candidatus Litorirhabdus singularis TaxID=2518993 RepID=A0ABT3TFK1_9GAMM|nr:class I adenylate-forming enzyme family protein [Candidatus Litorirhabdus singularis]MCX2981087.1 hypothetical protein [Candidatus Litorirhabdus singularis]
MSDYKRAFDEALAQLTAAGSPFATQSITRHGVDYVEFAEAPATMLEVFTAAAVHGDKEFVIYEGERWTFTQMLQLAASIGHQLQQELGVNKGDRVVIAMRNYPEWMAAFIAIISIGAVAVPLNSWGKARELQFAIEDAGARVAFCDQQRFDLIATALEDAGIPAVIVRPEQPNSGVSVYDLEHFVQGHETATMPAVAISGEDLALMLYTSGTTGAPKGAISTHYALGQAIQNFEVMGMASAMINPEAIGAMMESGLEPTQMLAVPLFHVSGCHAVFMTALKAGRKIVMLYKWDPEIALEMIESEKITIANAAPAQLLQLFESPNFDSRDTSSLSSVGAGGSATPPRAARLIEQKVTNGYPGTGWGLTETNAIGTAFTGKPFQSKPNSAGFPYATVQISIRDANGEELPTGTAGELWIKTPTLIREYWNRPEATAKDFVAGWFNSGDIGYFDEDGYLFLSDRAKDMVIRGGENIYPAEIESVLFDHPDIVEAAVFGVPDEKMGEALAAAVVPREGTELSPADVTAYAAEHLANFKVPHQVWIHSAPLPRNPSGKVLKKDLRAGFQPL